ncbi:hypothetical protein [Herbaspirillum robiniae]
MEDLALAFVQMFGDLFEAATTFVASYDGDAAACAHEPCARSFTAAFGVV